MSTAILTGIRTVLRAANQSESTDDQVQPRVVDWGITGNWTVGGSLRLMTNDSEAAEKEARIYFFSAERRGGKFFS
eukprot:g49742.t1